MAIQTIRLYLTPESIADCVYISQLDTKRVIRFLIYDDEGEYTIPSGSEVSINGQKADKNLFLYTEDDYIEGEHIIAKSGNVVTVRTTPQMSAYPGDCACQIRISKDGQDIGVLGFTMVVKKTPLADEQGYSKADLPSIIKYQEEQEKGIEEAEKYAKESKQHAQDSEAWAVGQRDGVDVESTDETFENNSKYYSEQSQSSADNSATSAQNAATSATSAATSASNAATSESNAATSASDALASENNAALSETNAAASEQNAATSASNAATSESNASTSAQDSADSATAAQSSADDASDSAVLSQSWAEGGTGTRTGEDTNNAKYWAQTAEAAAHLDTMTNDRMGIGKPDKLTTEASNGTFSALGVAIRSFIDENAEEFSRTWLQDSDGNTLAPDARQLYRVVLDVSTGESALYYWSGTAYEAMTSGGGGGTSIGDVSGVAATTFARTASITWSDPADVVVEGITLAAWDGTLLVRKAGSAPTSRIDGTTVLNSKVRNAYSSTPFVDTGLEYGTTYYYRFFPYTTGKLYTNGSSVSVTPQRQTITPTPSISETPVYDGSQKTITIDDFDSTKMTVTGNTGTLAGDYTAVLTPVEGYKWSDGTYGNLELSWAIAKASVTPPTTVDGYTYDGQAHDAITSQYDTSMINVTGTHSATEVGSYTYTMSLVDGDNYKWSTGTSADIVKSWRIVAELLEVPTVTADLTYNGSSQSPTIGTYDTDKISVSGTSQVDAGTYNAVFHIIDPTRYLWSDQTSADKEVPWTIKKAKLTAPTVTSNLTYTGSEQHPTVSAYDTDKISVTGIDGTNAGTYTATISLVDDDNYCWTDDTTADKTASWSIAKAAGTVTLSKSSVTLDASDPTDTVALSAPTGALSIASQDTSVATVSPSSMTISGGTLTISSVNETNGTTRVAITIAESSNYEQQTAYIDVTCAFSSIYGAEWDGSSTTAWSRTDDAAGFTDPVPYVSGATSYGSPFDDCMPWSGMVKEERTGGTMVKIPKFWYKITQNGAGMKVQISNGEQDGFSVSPAHMDRGDGKGERDYVYVGRYHCGSTAYKSVTGQTPKANATRSNFRSSIHALGTDIWQMDFATRFTLWLLYIVEFANWNSQAKIGYGCGNNSAAQAMGYTDSMPYHTGTTQSSRTTYGLGTQYRYIEGLWDNVYDWIDGCYYNSSGLNIILNPSNFSDSSGGTAVGIPSSGYPSAFSVKNVSGTFPTFIPTAASGSDSTYSCDGWSFDASSPCLFGGGNYSQGLSRGLFCVYCSGTSGALAGLGSRLMELP